MTKPLTADPKMANVWIEAKVERHEFHGNEMKLWADPLNRFQQPEKTTMYT